MKMNVFLVLSCVVLVATEYSPSSAHMVPDNSLSTNHVVVSNALSQSLDARSPPVVIVGQSLSHTIARKVPPPANCIPLGNSCKSSNSVCCDFCAFCQCRLFRTVCYCRMGNPRC
ncbi:hypothetical protein NQD34_003391 [Periophthalmus magnuspinnatus]|nr:hypothetical protein NQD34_003391 [Periophthalmus magnuspinnatus]